jgi:formylglycine-generating enzyme required for sulfatase activity
MSTPEETCLFETTEGDPEAPAQPQQIGRYRVMQILGRGGSGVVYLAHDEQLHRFVAIKVPHRGLLSHPEAIEAYLKEARTVAGLDHPNIVPVHDVGSTPELACFVVSKYIEGTTLEQRIRSGRPSVAESVDLVTTIAETLHFAHSKGVVHRDVKPGNILLDALGKPYVADFGLALREDEIGRGPTCLGTPSYMSPEQARGEGHRVDGRSDIFSLAVVLYELLTGHRPFRANDRGELLEQIATLDPRPPRQWDDKLPRDLERACLKALSKRACDRYTTARDFADDLRHALPAGALLDVAGGVVSQPPAQAVTPPPAPSRVPSPVVPKGLCAFDEHDGDFFLELLPGPRDRNGLPDSIRFWKTRIEERAPARPMTVGLLYGSSGCGKSSLVRAGLLPRLSEQVIAIYVEATPDETELRLLRGLRACCPGLSEAWGLKETAAALRRGSGRPEGRKLLIILDQFEQWLHAHNEAGAELTQALRQCDGRHIQCLILVRDDFYLAVNRLFQQIEVPIEEGHNSALVDLFDLEHARKVLIALGQAYGRLPESTTALSTEQSAFLARAIEGLAQNGRITCIRLALFVLMMRGRTWSPESLRSIGGMEGVGVMFLEETFSSLAAPPTHRLHQQAARDVLRVLLPEAGTNIKGQMQPVETLLEVSGYSDARSEFDALLRILVGELRLISPTNPEGRGAKSRPKDAGVRQSSLSSGSGEVPLSASGRYYQLTHDFLVPAVREWLTRSEQETPSGRAQLLLSERAAFWTAKPEVKQLPSLLEWLTILGRTRRSHWTDSQRSMMRVVSRRHVARIVTGAAAILALAVLAVGLFGLRHHLRQRELADHLVEQLLNADLTRVAAVSDQLSGLPGTWRERLARIAGDDSSRVPERLRAHLAIVRDDPRSVGFLVGQLFDAAPAEFSAMLQALRFQAARSRDALWPLATDSAVAADRRFRAAVALAELDGGDARWRQIAEPTAAALVRVDLLTARDWTARLRPVRALLLPSLAAEFRSGEAPQGQRILAASILADYAADDPNFLARVLQEADTAQFRTLIPAVKAHQAVSIGILEKAMAGSLESVDGDFGRRTRSRANLAAALLLLDRPAAVERLLGQNDDPDARTALIDLLPSVVEFEFLWSMAAKVKSALGRQAVLLALDAYRAAGRLNAEEGARLQVKLREIFIEDDSAAVHSAAEWLLRRLAGSQGVDALVGQLEGKERSGWRVTSSGHTMAVIRGPIHFEIGSPRDEPRRDGGEDRAPAQIPYSYEIGTHEVTVGQFVAFFPKHRYAGDVSPTLDSPINYVSWYDVAKYCRRLDEVENVPEEERIFPPVEEIDPERELDLPKNWLERSGYRWPMEAEWEYACRAGTTTMRFFGSLGDALPEYGYWMANATERCRPVASLRPNPLGLFDVLGNVGEWCFDLRLDYTELPPKDDDSWWRIPAGTQRVFRGGNYRQMSKDLRSAKRDSSNAHSGLSHNGFRIARTVPSARPHQTSKEDRRP